MWRILCSRVVWIPIAAVTIPWILSWAYVPTRQSLEFAPKADFALVPVDIINMNYSPDGVDPGSLIFVHGMGSNPDTTWQGDAKPKPTLQKAHPSQGIPIRKDQKINWITEFLYEDLPRDLQEDTRIFFFNYDSYWLRDAAERRRSQFGQDLFEAIVTMERKAIIKASDLQLERPTNVFKQIKGAVFLGTPHRGSKSAWLGSMIAYCLKQLNSNPDIVKAITYDSLELQDMHRRFEVISKYLRLVNFYETRPTPRPFKLGSEIVVQEQSATLDRPNVETIGLNANHVGLNKFGERNGDYKTMRDKLIELMEECIKRK
ncbi:hypothetical protein ONZ43_g5073 [Nemania bipapillata]|uniref:Uncharacterized protein n=1 Tax=Nemania bipapillata TaxID=110536 RepID=A0ACC2IF43_9PEZI|nr:hypothetical protein ONZ43_g5073 [Nemania bipapillata]